MRWGVAIWVLLYGGIAVIVWAVAGFLSLLIFLAGLAAAYLALLLADWWTRERIPKRRLHDYD